MLLSLPPLYFIFFMRHAHAAYFLRYAGLLMRDDAAR